MRADGLQADSLRKEHVALDRVQLKPVFDIIPDGYERAYQRIRSATPCVLHTMGPSLLRAGLLDVFSLSEATVPEPSTNSFGSPLPVFRVKNVDASIAYYREALGFELRWRAGDGFACVAREKCSIFLTHDNQS
jgi:hypothetical protein